MFFILKNRTGEENLEDALARCDELDHMKGKFNAKKTKEVSPRIVELQRNLGFEPGEPVTPKNFHRLIPGAVSMHLNALLATYLSCCILFLWSLKIVTHCCPAALTVYRVF